MSLKLLSKNKLFLSVLFLIFLGYIWLAWQPAEVLLTKVLVDDSFYYFKTASNLVKGFGPTFDGEHLTNGYHPLWMGINMLVYRFWGYDKLLPIHILLTVGAVLFLLNNLILFEILFSFTANSFLSSLLVLAYALNPWNLSFYLGGLETPLALFLFLVFFRLALKTFSKHSERDFLWLGMVGGLMILSRLDYGVYFAFVSGFFAWKTKDWKKTSVLVLPAVFLAAPWFLYNYFYFGSFIPASGLAYTLINHRLWFYKPRTLTYILIWCLHNFLGTVSFTFNTINLPVYYAAKNLLKSFFWMAGLCLTPTLIVLYFYKKRKEEFLNFCKELFSLKEWSALLVFFFGYFLLVIAHGAVRWSGRPWYFATFPILAMIFIAIILSRPYLYFYRENLLIALFILLGVLNLSNFKSILSENDGQLEMYQTSLWMRDNLPPDARVAAFNSGIHGYFSDRFVMDSDGLINNSAYEAMKNNRLWDLFKEAKIGYIADYDITLTYRFKSFLGIDDAMSHLSKLDTSKSISRTGKYGGSNVNVYKIAY